MSPVIRTSASTPAQSNFKAVMGVMVNTSRLLGEPGTISSFCAAIARPASSDGTGAGGGYEKQSSVSCKDRMLEGAAAGEPPELLFSVSDMMCKEYFVKIFDRGLLWMAKLLSEALWANVQQYTTATSEAAIGL